MKKCLTGLWRDARGTLATLSLPCLPDNAYPAPRLHTPPTSRSLVGPLPPDGRRCFFEPACSVLLEKIHLSTDVVIRGRHTVDGQSGPGDLWWCEILAALGIILSCILYYIVFLFKKKTGFSYYPGKRCFFIMYVDMILDR